LSFSELHIARREKIREHILAPLSAPYGKLVDRLWNFSWVYADFVLRPDMLSLARPLLGEGSARVSSPPGDFGLDPFRVIGCYPKAIREVFSIRKLSIACPYHDVVGTTCKV